MQVILKPVSHPELGEIIINDNLFAIGRHETPFADYEPQLVARLSRRHARIFEQDGVVYIADLGSLNGTSVNGQSVDTLPVRLQRGDQICFTDLCYQIEILGAASRGSVEQPASPPVQLILVPEKQKLVLEPIVVTRFPFLINKASEVFSRYRETLPKEVSYISRRHAHLFLKGQDLFIEDLGSTNGTFVGGERLEEQARQLHADDVIAFGGDNFVYRVQLLYAGQEPASEAERDASELLTATAGGGEDVTRTTFVTSANSFLDIFCVEDSNDDDEAAEGKRRGGGEDDTGRTGGSGRWRRLAGRPLTLLREIRGEATGEKKPGRRKYWLAAVAVAGGLLIWAYLNTVPQREIRQLLESGDYMAAATRANRFLVTHPDNREVSELATESLIKALLPEWQRAVVDGDFDAAEEQLAKGLPLAGSNADSQRLLEIMQWVTQLERFIAQRGGADAPITMFREEEPIGNLVEWWDSDAKTHRRSLGTLAQYDPDFQALRAQVFTHVRTLDSQKALSLAAIERLMNNVRERLQNDNAGTLHALLLEFENKYPRIEGTDKLRADLEKYARIDADVHAGRWVSARRRVAENVFETPVFQTQVRSLTQRELPSTDVVRRYAEADSDWQAGDTEQALSALERLKTERWGEVAERRLQHCRKVLDDFERLQAAKGQADYQPELLAFFRELDPVSDSWFMHSVEAEFRIHSDKAIAQAEHEFTSAETAWNSYRNAGGIRALHRLQAGVSSAYRRLAGLLGDAYRHSNEGLAIHALLKSDYADKWGNLHSRIVKEIKLQRQSLLELTMVLEPSLKQAKLDLLPELKADEL